MTNALCTIIYSPAMEIRYTMLGGVWSYGPHYACYMYTIAGWSAWKFFSKLVWYEQTGMSPMHSCNTADSCITGHALGTARKIRDTETFIVSTCRSPLLHVYYNGGILECAYVRVRKMNTLGTNFCQVPPVKISCFELFIVWRYGLELQ